MDLPKLYRLLTWFSPSFPVGSYAYSHGLEYAVESGLVHNRTSLEEWLEGILRFGTGRTDGMFFVAAFRVNPCDLESLSDLATALKGTREIGQESLRQGRAFTTAMASLQPTFAHNALNFLSSSSVKPLPYPIAVALACRLNEIPLNSALAAYLHSFVANLVSAGIRLVPLGHTDGQIALARMEIPVAEVVKEALQTTQDDWGSATPTLDWVSMKHETQHTRLFRS